MNRRMAMGSLTVTERMLLCHCMNVFCDRYGKSDAAGFGIIRDHADRIADGSSKDEDFYVWYAIARSYEDNLVLGPENAESFRTIAQKLEKGLLNPDPVEKAFSGLALLDKAQLVAAVEEASPYPTTRRLLAKLLETAADGIYVDSFKLGLAIGEFLKGEPDDLEMAAANEIYTVVRDTKRVPIVGSRP